MFIGNKKCRIYAACGVSQTPNLKQFLWGDSFWSRSYFVATSGGVTLDVLKEYVETQNRKPGRPYGTKKKK